MAAVAVLFLPVLLAGAAIPARGSDWPAGVLYVCDSNDDRLLWILDRDGSGTADAATAGELGVFYDDGSPGPDLSTPDHLAMGDDGTVYLLDGGTLDTVLALEDLNGDGDANDASEFRVFYDASAGGPRLYTPNTLARAGDGSFYVADDGSSGKRIIRLKDADGDGDALDAGEASVVYDSSALSTPVAEDLESLAPADGVLYVADAALQTVFVLSDTNDDGDYLDAEESRVFFRASAETPLADIESMIAAEEGLYVADKATGTILLLRDGSGDGTALDPGEAVVFLDATSAARVSGVTDFLRVAPGQFLVLDNSRDGIFAATDLNGDGDALDEGETRRWLIDDGTNLATPHGLVLGPRRGNPPPDGSFIRADSTGDGRLDISDSVATLGFLFLGSGITVCVDALDSDDSGEVSITDAIYALNYLFAGGAAPPPPFPDAGPDPTDDTNVCLP